MKVKILLVLLSIIGVNTSYAANWSYSGANGPEHWGQLDASFAVCETGKQQTPINIQLSQVKKNSSALPIAINYTFNKDKLTETLNGETTFTFPSGKLLTYNGHTLQIDVTDAANDDAVFWQNSAYHLLQFHFHSPSEHLVDGKTYPLEIHFVNENVRTGKVLVLGVFIAEGKKDNPTLTEIIKDAPTSLEQSNSIDTNIVLAEHLLPPNSAYFAYMGSLTTPPCTEGFQWIVFKNPIYASKQQIQALAKILQDNVRPVQKLNGRVVKEYKV